MCRRIYRRFNVDIERCSATVARSEFRETQIVNMPNTKSAERRVRNSARKQVQNTSIKSRLHTLETKYLAAVTAGKKDDAATALRAVTSAFDKAAKTGAVHKATANRKKSRLSLRLNAVK